MRVLMGSFLIGVEQLSSNFNLFVPEKLRKIHDVNNKYSSQTSTRNVERANSAFGGHSAGS